MKTTAKRRARRAPRMLHVYGQRMPWGAAHVVGNRVALRRLRDALNGVLERGGSVTFRAVAADENTFTVAVILNDDGWDDVGLPYLSPGLEKRETYRWPSSERPGRLVTVTAYDVEVEDLDESHWDHRPERGV